MNQLMTQIRELAPSAREPLFRRLMIAEELSYLREKNSIIGFELDTGTEQALSGFTLIAIQKHTIYAYCSDLKEQPKLILFPPIDKLFDPAFELLGLTVTKRRFINSSFSGADLGRGVLKELVRDLTPPEKEVDIPQMVAEQMAEYMKHTEDAPKPEPIHLEKETPEKGMPAYEEDPGYGPDLNEGFGAQEDYSGFDEYSGYDGYGDYDSGYDGYGDYEEGYAEPCEEPKPVEDERSTKLKAQEFNTLSEVSDYCSGQLGVQRPLAVTLVNRALQSEVSPEYRIELAVTLFCKLFDEKRI